MKRKTIGYCLVPALILAVLCANAYGGSIRNTKHNLSMSGPGTVKAADEDRICVFCHTPHKAKRGARYLWNRADSTVNYLPYQSSTQHATAGQPTGASKLCLSCHDGTIALGAVTSEPKEIPFKGGVRFMPPGKATKLGTDLTDDHPVSFQYDNRLVQRRAELSRPRDLPPHVKMDKNGEMQCTACHNPHDDTYGRFLVTSNQYAALCVSCHKKQGWSASSHSSSNARWNKQGSDPWANTNYDTVAENGCESCHRPHTAGRDQRLLKHKFEEDNCLVCHSGNVASTNIEDQLIKQYGHLVQDYTGVHDSTEDFSSGNVQKHIECEDCHNPHLTNGDPSPGPTGIRGANKGVKGINIGGQKQPQAQELYEVCFKCHSDNSVTTALPVTRKIAQVNVRMQFRPGSPSFHPVAAAGTNPDVVSLLPPRSTQSRISCTDCHNTDDTSGAKGPHGSNYRHLLERNYETSDFTDESPYSYGLCYKCHSRSSILNNDSFERHREHVVDQKTPCSACHDSHGVSNTQGNPVNNSHLMNFDLTIVRPNGQGHLRFEKLGRFNGQCYLNCHGKEHVAEQYP